MSGKDYPDWGGFPISGQSYPLKDLAEHAVRLGSPVNYDRGGSVAFMDTFEFGLNKWFWTHSPTASDPALSSLYAENGGFSVKFDTGVTAGGGIAFYHLQPTLPPSRWGLTIRWGMDILPQRIHLALTRMQAAYYDQAYIIIDQVTNSVLLDAGGAGYETIATLPSFYLNPTLFHYLKITADFETNQYLRINLDGTVHDVSAYVLKHVVFAAAPRITVYFGVDSVGATQTPVYLDSVILTHNDT